MPKVELKWVLGTMRVAYTRTIFCLGTGNWAIDGSGTGVLISLTWALSP